MANDGGLIATLEQWFADQIATITSDSETVFRTADIWRHQVGASRGGMEAFERYAPFAFVGYFATDAGREGDYDLKEVLEFAILIGVTDSQAGNARVGDARRLGVSKLRDLVIAQFDKQHPGSEFDCDEIYYTKDFEVLDTPDKYAIEMRFETSYAH